MSQNFKVASKYFILASVLILLTPLGYFGGDLSVFLGCVPDPTAGCQNGVSGLVYGLSIATELAFYYGFITFPAGLIIMFIGLIKFFKKEGGLMPKK